MGVLIAQQARAFVRRWPLALIAGGAIVLAIAVMGDALLWTYRQGEMDLGTLGNYLPLSIVWPLAVLVISFEFASAARIAGMEESVGAHTGTAHRHWLAAMLPPAVVVVIVSGIFLVFKLVTVFTQGMQHLLGWHVATSVLLNVFAPCAIALLLGFVAARHLKRFAGYAVIAVFAFLAGPYSEIIPMVAQAGIMWGGPVLNLYPVRDFFGVLAPDPTWYIDSLYGFPLEQERWWLAGFWLTLMLAILAPTLTPRHVRWSRFAPSLLWCFAGLLFAAFLLPSQELRRDPRFFGGGSTVTEQVHYQIRSDEHPQRDVPGGFAIDRYEMDMAAGRQLEAVVTVHIADDETQGKYRFTLYHGYHLIRVRDSAGRPLDFSQEGDYVTVRSEARQERLTFEYRGSGGINIANSQGVFLPGYFPYYPVPGFVRVWDEQAVAPAMDVTDARTAEFSVRFKTRIPLFSDLEMRKGRFEGRSGAPTFIGGMVAERKVGNHRVIYLPVAIRGPEALTSLTARVRELELQIGVTESPIPDDLQVIQGSGFQALAATFLPPNTLMVGMFDELIAAEVLIAPAPMKLDRANLKAAFLYVINDSPGFAHRDPRQDLFDDRSAEAVSISEEIARLEDARRSARTDQELKQEYVLRARSVVFQLFNEKIQAIGEDEALRDTYQYLLSDSDLSELEFLTRSGRGGTK